MYSTKHGSNIATSYLKVRDYSMSVIKFLKASMGNLSLLSYIFRNPEPLGTEFKTVTWSIIVGWSWSGIIWSWEPYPPVPRYLWRRQRGWGRGSWKDQQVIVYCCKICSWKRNQQRQPPPLVLIWLGWWKPTPKDFARLQYRVWQRIFLADPT